LGIASGFGVLVLVLGTWTTSYAAPQRRRASTRIEPASLIASIASPNTIVASDGKVPTVVTSTTRVHGGSRGTGTLAPAPAASEAGRRDPGDTGRESIIGTDDRTQNTDTTTYPNRAVAQVLFSNAAGSFLCTGWFINKNTVVTAGHCVYDPVLGWNAVSTYEVIPGRNGATAPYGSCTAKRLYTVNAWINSADETYDYGAIKLNCNIGNTVGFFGYFWTASTLNGTSATVTGYPGDKPFGTQWFATRTVAATETRQVFYDADTFGGNSGGPVWAQDSSFCPGSCGYAVHAYGVHGTGNHALHNHGTRITEEVFNNFTSWANAK
jgi:glutamyl endopeptidase